MIKQLIMAVTPLLIHDTSEVIQYARAIFNFTMLAWYVLYNNEPLRYIEHTLYRLENIKIAFKHHRLIDSTLYRPIFNYSKFYTISYFVQCI